MPYTLIYWVGIIGIPGKGPHHQEVYDPNRTIGQIIQTMTASGLVEKNKRIEMFKHYPGNLNKYDVNNPYWSHDTKLSEYVSQMGGSSANNVALVCVFI